MLALLLMAIATPAAATDPRVDAAVAIWQKAVDDVKAGAPAPGAALPMRMRYLIRLDEVTRQYLWVMDDPTLTVGQQRVLGWRIGSRLIEIDNYTTAELKGMIPASGWFDNAVDGRQVTHGAWLIAQHSPDAAFRERALGQMEAKVRTGGVDARDYALIYDRVQILKGRPQKYGSQMRCIDGHLQLQPIADEAAVDAQRAQIGWSQTIAETKGDNSVGKPCAQ
jgi:hypothetical protein